MKSRDGVVTFDRRLFPEADDDVGPLPEVGEKLYTPAAIAATLGVTTPTVHQWIKRGDIKALRFGGPKGRLRVRESDWREFLKERYGPATSGPT